GGDRSDLDPLRGGPDIQVRLAYFQLNRRIRTFSQGLGAGFGEAGLLYTGPRLASGPQVPTQRHGSKPVRTAVATETLAIGLKDALKKHLRPVRGAGDLCFGAGETLGEYGLPQFRTVLGRQTAVVFERGLRRRRAGLERRGQFEGAIKADSERIVQG